MFDDQQNNQMPAGVPKNLPIGEPEDMFEGVDNVSENNPAPQAVIPSAISETESQPVVEQKSALGAGVLKPKDDMFVEEDIPSLRPDMMSSQPRISTMPQGDVDSSPAYNQSYPSDANMGGVTMSSAHGQDIYKIKEPALGKGLMKLVIAVVVLAIAGGGGWWVYNSFMKEDISFGNLDTTQNLELIEKETVFPEQVDKDVVEPEIVDFTNDNDYIGDIVDDRVLFGEPIDKDADGLDDDREVVIGTDPNNWDSDGDELGDGDEITIWKTDPLNPDTDGDSYLDGAEIKNGYSPVGPGKLFELPAKDEVETEVVETP